MSARNQLPATVKKIKTGTVMAEVTMQVGDQELVAVITRGSTERMRLKAGDLVFAVIKATEVMVAKESPHGKRGVTRSGRSMRGGDRRSTP